MPRIHSPVIIDADWTLDRSNASSEPFNRETETRTKRFVVVSFIVALFIVALLYLFFFALLCFALLFDRVVVRLATFLFVFLASPQVNWATAVLRCLQPTSHPFEKQRKMKLNAQQGNSSSLSFSPIDLSRIPIHSHLICSLVLFWAAILALLLLLSSFVAFGWFVVFACPVCHLFHSSTLNSSNIPFHSLCLSFSPRKVVEDAFNTLSLLLLLLLYFLLLTLKQQQQQQILFRV